MTDEEETVTETGAPNPEMTEDSEPEFDLEAVEEQVSALHDQLDQIKQAGQELPEQIQANLSEDAEQEEVMNYQRVLTKANLLYRRIENGDSNVVRGE